MNPTARGSHSRHRSLIATSFVLGMLLLPASAHAVDRATAAATVVTNVAIPHPESDRMLAFGPQATVSGGTVIRDGFDGRDLTSVPTAACWLFWLNPRPEAKFGHSTILVLVDQLTGTIVYQGEMQFWPRYSGVNYYRNSSERTGTSPDLIYAGPGAFSRPQAKPSVREQLDGLHILAPDPTAGKWALIISGTGTAANPDEKADTDSARAIYRDVLGVPNDNITFLDNLGEAALCAAIEAMPKKCPKLYVYVTAHGLRNQFGSDGSIISSALFAHKLKELMAGEYCVVMAQCYSGSFLDAFRDSTLAGVHMTSASADTEAWSRTDPTDPKFPWVGEVFTHYWANCHRAGKRGTDAYQCARDSVSAYVARRYKAGTPPHDPKPQSSVAFKDTTRGQATAFKAPAGTATVCIQWKHGTADACGNATVECRVVTGPDTTWKAVKSWNWNLGKTRYFDPNGPGATGEYRLVSHANGYPDCGDIRFLTTGVPETPSSSPTFPAGAIGWRDGLHDEFRSSFGPGIYAFFDGAQLNNVPANVGATNLGESPLDFFMPLTPDPDRPGLYNNLDPQLGYNGSVTLEIYATGAFTPSGSPSPFVPLEVRFVQGPTLRTFTTFAQNVQGQIVVAPVDLGPMLPQQFQVHIGSPSNIVVQGGPLPGYVAIDAVLVDFHNFGTIGVEPTTAPAAYRLSLARPNPFSGGVDVELAMPHAGSVHMRVFDLSGRAVRDLPARWLSAGTQRMHWDGLDQSAHAVDPGVYFLEIGSSQGRLVQRAVRVR